MSERSPDVPVPLKLALRRARYQLVPIFTMLISALLAGWLWARHAHSATTSGEVSAIRVAVESKVEGLLEQIPQPIHLFDSVRNGQLVARVDLTLFDKQIQRLRATSQPIAEREAQIAELQARLDAREIKSPIDGTVMEIHQWPGQSVKLTKPIMVIAAEQADFIIAYLREDQPLRPVPGMKVTVRTRGGVTPRRTFETYVRSVGPQIEPMPQRHLRNPNVAEWAMPVQIAMPAEAELKPGEMVDVEFHAKAD
jgi:multidrug resistance efflux pump